MGARIMDSLFCFLLLTIIMLPLTLIWRDYHNPIVCTETSKIAVIDKITYRGGYVTLENGSVVDVGQGRALNPGPFQVGTDYCIKTERENPDEPVDIGMGYDRMYILR